jgi:hypothetical protein
MPLNPQQFKFTQMVSLLIQYAYFLGYTINLGDAWSKSVYGAHSRNSKHFDRLAIDINLFEDGEYLTGTAAHEPLGKFWKLLGGSWGGDFKHKDGNHYSLGE